MTTTASTVPPVPSNPRQSLRLRLVALASYPVSWACFMRDRSVGPLVGNEFVRLARIALVDADGREHEARLSPAEARDLGQRLLNTADYIDAMNAARGNGHF